MKHWNGAFWFFGVVSWVVTTPETTPIESIALRAELILIAPSVRPDLGLFETTIHHSEVWRGASQSLAR